MLYCDDVESFSTIFFSHAQRLGFFLVFFSPFSWMDANSDTNSMIPYRFCDWDVSERRPWGPDVQYNLSLLGKKVGLEWDTLIASAKRLVLREEDGL